jgi:quercetin dioxygenase-like cupin family protein
MAIIRIYTGADGKSHFQEIEPDLQEDTPSPGDPKWPLDARAVIHEESGIIVRRFDPERSNPWHHAPGRVCAITLSGAVEIEIGDGTKRTIGPGDILIAEDLTGQGHYTREVGSEPRVSVFVPLR